MSARDKIFATDQRLQEENRLRQQYHGLSQDIAQEAFQEVLKRHGATLGKTRLHELIEASVPDRRRIKAQEVWYWCEYVERGRLATVQITIESIDSQTGEVVFTVLPVTGSEAVERLTERVGTRQTPNGPRLFAHVDWSLWEDCIPA